MPPSHSRVTRMSSRPAAGPPPASGVVPRGSGALTAPVDRAATLEGDRQTVQQRVRAGGDAVRPGPPRGPSRSGAEGSESARLRFGRLVGDGAAPLTASEVLAPALVAPLCEVQGAQP